MPFISLVEQPEPLDTATLARSCKKDAFTKNFETGIKIISYYNVKTDVDHLFEAKYHFHGEKFQDGKALIIKGVEDITNDVKKEKFCRCTKEAWENSAYFAGESDRAHRVHIYVSLKRESCKSANCK